MDSFIKKLEKHALDGEEMKKIVKEVILLLHIMMIYLQRTQMSFLVNIK